MGELHLRRPALSGRVQLSQAELDGAFFDKQAGGRFPPVLSSQQASEMLQIPLKTLYEWSSRGYLRGCSRRRGKRLFFWRDRLVRELFEGKEWEP
jgi:hypothetical protein